MKRLLFIIQFALVVLTQAQTSGFGPLPVPATDQLKNVDRFVDSLHPLLTRAKDDTAKINLLLQLGQAYSLKYNWDSSFLYSEQAMRLSEKMQYARGIFDAQNRLAFLFQQTGNYAKALELSFINLPIAEQQKDTVRLFFTIRQLSWIYADMNDFTRQLIYARKLQQLALSTYLRKQRNPENFIEMSLIHLASALSGLNQTDSALYYYQLLYKIALSLKDYQGLALANGKMAEALLKVGNIREARSYYLSTINYSKEANRFDLIAYSYLGLARIFQQSNQMDSALYYAKLSLKDFQHLKLPAAELKSASFLDMLYTKVSRIDSAHQYLAMAAALKDSLFNEEKVKQVQNLQFAETLREQQIEQEEKEAQQLYETKLKIYGLIGGLVVVLMIAYFLYRNNRQKQNANGLLLEKNKQIESTLTELKSTQAQLIQSEKMASLGELTAGIAHEIQNPLNFVNNFSEVNTELIDELQTERSKVKGERNDELEDEILNDVKQNLEKIIHHGKRADAIVKGMLQHSRVSTGQKEPTDINALVDEYLRLSYHGLRAKDKTFNATLKTNFDNSLSADQAGIGKINVVPQDIGRVLLNLFNNAFYAVKPSNPLKGEQYEPTVIVSTKRISSPSGAEGLLISVKDNGVGIPQKIVDKIFQPFFTTKPTGEGTGLGLSLSYDIIKSHGGEIKVKTREGEGSEFIITISN